MEDDEVRFPVWDDSPTRSSGRTKTEADSVVLTRHLETELKIKTKTLGTINRLAVQREIARWLKAGTTPEQIRQMIRIYVLDKNFRKGNGPEWKRFLYHRDTLLARTTVTTDVDWFDTGEEEEFIWDSTE